MEEKVSALDIVLRNPENSILSKMEQKGIKLTEINPFFNDLYEIMSDKKVTNFFDKYFQNMSEIKTTVIYMKLFRLFQEKYKNATQEELSKYVNIYLWHHAMTKKDIRRTLIKATVDHLEDNRVPIMNLTPKVLKDQRKRLKIKKRIERLMSKMDQSL